MGDSFDIATFFHRLSMEFPLYVKWTDDDGGTVRIVADDMWSFTAADSKSLVVGTNDIVPWNEVTSEDIDQAIHYIFCWLLRRMESTDVIKGAAERPKLNYGKMKLGSFVYNAFAPAKTMATFLEDNKEYLHEFFSEQEFADGIYFLRKLRSIL